MNDIDPIFVSVADAARILGVSKWLMYKRLDDQLIESRYEGRKRLVDYASLKAYAKNLSRVPPSPEDRAS